MQPGSLFGPATAGHVRLNLGVPAATLREGIARLACVRRSRHKTTPSMKKRPHRRHQPPSTSSKSWIAPGRARGCHLDGSGRPRPGDSGIISLPPLKLAIAEWPHRPRSQGSPRAAPGHCPQAGPRERRRRRPRNRDLVTTGGQEALFLLVQAQIEPGDEVVMPDPRYTSYDATIDLAGGAASSSRPTRKTPSTSTRTRSTSGSPQRARSCCWSPLTTRPRASSLRPTSGGSRRSRKNET